MPDPRCAFFESRLCIASVCASTNVACPLGIRSARLQLCRVHAFDPSIDCSPGSAAGKKLCYHRPGACYESGGSTGGGSGSRGSSSGGASNQLTASSHSQPPQSHGQEDDERLRLRSAACRKRPGLHPLVTFRHWGLLSGSVNESAFRSSVYSALTGQFLALDDIVARLGHTTRRTPIAILALDCEGCEWDVYARMASEQSRGFVGLRRFEQVLTELHFAATLRFTLEHASRDAPALLRLLSGSGFVPFASRLSEGFPQDRLIDPKLVAAGLLPGYCCRELSLINRNLLSDAGPAGASRRPRNYHPIHSHVPSATDIASASATAVAAFAPPAGSTGHRGRGGGGKEVPDELRGRGSGEKAAAVASGGPYVHAVDRDRDRGAGANLVTDFFEHQRRHPAAGYEEPVRAWHDLILASQQPQSCTRLCQCVHVRGAFFSNIRGIAACVLNAALRGCAIVEEDKTARPAMATFVTSPAMRRTCQLANRSLAFHCYFRPLSNCSRAKAGIKPREALTNVYALDGEMSGTDEMLAEVEARTGLRSELLILSAAVSYVMRPQPELAHAIRHFGASVGAGYASRPRVVGVHMRSDEKLGVRSLGVDRWRASPAAFGLWARRVSRFVGADKVWLMSDSYSATVAVAGESAVEGRGGGGARDGRDGAGGTDRRADGRSALFAVVPAPLSCSPAHAAGVLGHAFSNRPAAAGGGANWGPHMELQRLARTKHAVVADVTKGGAGGGRAGSNRNVCGPTWAADDGILLAAGAMLLANGLAFIGTLISNVDVAIVELMASRSFPPSVYDVLNDVYPGFKSADLTERPWHGAVGNRTREPEKERLMPVR